MKLFLILYYLVLLSIIFIQTYHIIHYIKHINIKDGTNNIIENYKEFLKSPLMKEISDLPEEHYNG